MSSSGRVRGAKITIFLIDGTPEGPRLSTKSGWTGACLDFGRSDFAAVRSRPELARTGVYVLVGPDDARPDKDRVYVGEADVVRTRLDMHQRAKDFWTRGFVFISREDEGLNKAHVRYLEALLVNRASASRSALVENATAPEPRGLGEAERAEMDAFLDEVLLLLPLLGVGHFTRPATRYLSVVAAAQPSGALVDGPAPQIRPPANPSALVPANQPDTRGDEAARAPTSSSGEQAVYTLEERGRGAGRVTVRGQGRDTALGFVVLEGSFGPQADGVMSPGYASMRAQLRLDGVLVDGGDGTARFARDHAFQSPSAGATMLTGSNRNGPKVWRDGQGRSLAQVRAREVGA